MVTVIELANEFELRDLKGYSVPRIGWCKSLALRKALLHGKEANNARDPKPAFAGARQRPSRRCHSDPEVSVTSHPIQNLLGL